MSVLNATCSIRINFIMVSGYKKYAPKELNSIAETLESFLQKLNNANEAIKKLLNTKLGNYSLKSLISFF